MAIQSIVQIDKDGKVIQCAKGAPAGQCGYKAGAKLCQKCGAVAVAVKAKIAATSDEETMEGPDGTTSPMKKPGSATPGEGPLEGEAEEGGEEMEDEATSKGWLFRRARRAGRMKSMGLNPDDFDDEAYVCAISRKMHDSWQEPCSMCVGGCVAENEMPSLLEVEGAAEEMFDGKVLSSGYASDIDVFVVDLKGADGSIREAFFFGDTGECFRWGLQDENEISAKSAVMDDADAITPEQARIIALEHVEGKALLVDVDRLGDEYVYVVEIEGNDDLSYDAYVSVKGEFIDYESYSPEDVADIDAEVAEIHFKRMYSEDDRSKMADEGVAMPDGSLPIANETDLRNAIRAYGRAKDPEKAREHIVSRAEKLGLENMIPEEWGDMLPPSMTEGPQKSAEEAEMELKRMYSEETRTSMAKEGLALPDGSYPIKDRADLQNAIQAYGRAKDKEAAKAHIMKRATDLGLEEMIPASWTGGGKMMGGDTEGADDAEEYVGMNSSKKPMSGAKSGEPEILASLMEFELIVAEEELKDIL